MEKSSVRKDVRTVKAGRIHFPVAPALSNNFSGLRAVPWIRLGGVWLEKAGFSIGESLKVKVLRKRVVIWVE
ncbi:type I toxin-antitoxin system toxin SymE [Cupriavidus phytorum]|uniref:Type I toxin-antitoxin system toxin SymE n=1 Tax=Cupriavidus phytorum TaxID=3024399 RepID=A0A2W7PQZ2_9BURK|nr:MULTISPECIES: SymE family type I addiction module toxin [Cupriavidus]PZX29075.1 type I toxin-antitoxin system toxin SymE [Cupriavidus alkaliphilus]